MSSMVDYFYKSLGDVEIPLLLQSTLAFFENFGINLKPIQLSCIIYIAAMEDTKAVEEIFRYIEEIHYREE